ncbi:hypothetical protein LTR85_003481 [Meristemomyces frigidus]|nr:hypothetical protein LTR85_003481 [Meristemomyces frigidus]
MPGYRRPQTTAFAPGDLKGFDALEKAFQSKQWSSPRQDRLEKSQALDAKRHTIATTYADIPSSPESSAGPQTSEGEEEEEHTHRSEDGVSESSAHQRVTPMRERLNGLMLRHTSGKVMTPPNLSRENSGLPPTPPTMANSDEAEPRAGTLASNAQFADAVRNALQTQKSGLSTPGLYLPTPDPSPPGTSENLASTSLHSIYLQPTGAHHLRQYSSSRADSYHTAREAPTPSASQLHLPHTPSPEIPSSDSWLDSIRGFGSGNAGVGLTSVAESPPSSHQRSRQNVPSEASEITGRSLTPTPLHRPKQRPRSPYEPLGSGSDFDKHISYIADQSFEEQASAEDVNNLVYQQIQEENVKRHSAISNDNAVSAGIWFLEQPIKDHKLRRTTKAQSLRNVSGGDNNSQRASMEDSARKPLRHKKATISVRSLESSPLVESNTTTRRTLRHSSAPSAPLSNYHQMIQDRKQAVLPARAHLAYSRTQPIPARSPERTLRHFPAEAKLENNQHVRHTSLDTNGSFLPSSPRKSLDARFLHPTTTPMSTSQLSDRSEAEVCEAQGVNIYPHNNHSLLVVQHGSRPVSKDTSTPSPTNHLRLTDAQLGFGKPLFTAHVQEPSPTLAPATVHVDSPLINPRTAPEPPAFKVIPPTPNEELDRQLAAPEDDEAQDERPSQPQRRLSLKQKARRFSESFIETPLFGRSLSLRKPKRAADDNEVRPIHLSPLWRPNYIWDGYDSEDDYDDAELDGLPGSARLPQGGDTSDYEERFKEQEAFQRVRDRVRLGMLPRGMSVRMPGFRGQGGFLLGNSLGLDRHGTNNRRHYVVKKESMGGMGSRGTGYVGELRKRSSEEMLKQMVGRKTGFFTLPFSGGRKVQYVGVEQFWQRMNERKAEKEEKEREKRRQMLREQIQHTK